MTCPCGSASQPVIELGDRGDVIRRCGGCGERIATQQTATPPPIASLVPASPPPRRQAPSAAAPDDVVGLVRARLAVIELEVARLEGLRTEMKQLRKMLSAAERVAQPRVPPFRAALEN